MSDVLSLSNEITLLPLSSLFYHDPPMALYFKIESDLIVFFGDTFNHRPSIKSLGAKFNGQDKTWVLKDSPEARHQASRIAKPLGLEPIKSRSTANASVQLPVTPLPDMDALDPAMGITISQLMMEADKIISQGFPTPVWVVGEIQSLNRRGAGTIFFDFADAKTGAHQTATVTVKCNLWQNTLSWIEKRHGKDKVSSVFTDGNKLRALVYVKLYKDRGQISLTIEDIDPSFTQGALALARAELLRKLRSLELDRKNKNLLFPLFPFHVALITSEGSRAQTDFVHQLSASGKFPGTLHFIACSMQGDRVPQDVTRAISIAVEHHADVIVLSRGGGSAADLRWFDGEEIALAIANCPIPVIAAIGHHDDCSVAEEIAHTREKTPTAAADRILDVFRDTRTAINERAHSLASALDREISHFDRTQADLRERLLQAVEIYFVRQRERIAFIAIDIERSFSHSINEMNKMFIQMVSQLNHFANAQLQKLGDGLHGLEQQLTRLDPTPWLASGWTQLSSHGRNLKNLEDVDVGDEITARLRDGVLSLRLESKQPRPPKEIKHD
jgi:exodeoxyribonuclease VII large subunit